MSSLLPSALLFDHDGVLVASEALHWAAWEKLLIAKGIPYNDSEIRRLVGKTAPEILSELLDLHRPGWTREQYDVQALAQEKNDVYMAIAQTDLRAYPGVAEGLKWARSKGIKTAAVSNARRRELESALRLVGLMDSLDLVLSRDDSGVPKPDPAPYLMAMTSLACEPSRCIAIEDSPPGLGAALLAKIPSAAILTNFSESAMRRPISGRPELGPEWVFRTIQEFFDHLMQIN